MEIPREGWERGRYVACACKDTVADAVGDVRGTLAVMRAEFTGFAQETLHADSRNVPLVGETSAIP